MWFVDSPVTCSVSKASKEAYFKVSQTLSKSVYNNINVKSTNFQICYKD